MTDRAKKVSELTALANAAGEDLLLIIDDPSGTPESKKITVANFFGNVATNTLIRNTLTVNGAVLLAGNTSISKTLTVSNNVNITGNIGINGSISVANAAVINSTGFWVGNPSGLKGDKGVTGDKGDKGNTGDSGNTGAKGDTGTTGAKGEKGDLGDKGTKGDTPAVPGPYINDTDAGNNGVSIGGLYYRSTGVVYIRLS